MHPQDLEPDTEAFLLRLSPDLAREWRGATADEIDAIERLAGRPLPRFYRWFLLRMGHSMGPLTYATLDFSAPTILHCHAAGLFSPNPRILMIGHDSHEIMPLHVHYDLDAATRDDALILASQGDGDEFVRESETFREMIARGCLSQYRVRNALQRCSGLLRDRDDDVLARLSPVMTSLGFTTPVPTGAHGGLYEGPREAMLTTAPLDAAPAVHYFTLAGADAGRLRRLLGEIVATTALSLTIDEWDPPLA